MENLLHNLQPVLSGWDTDPTDAANLTDDNVETLCTTGEKTMTGGWQNGYFTYDLGKNYKILVGGVGSLTISAGTGKILIEAKYNGTWYGTDSRASIDVSEKLMAIKPFFVFASELRLICTNSAASTISPHINQVYAYKLA
jgi:hypothetical protein